MPKELPTNDTGQQRRLDNQPPKRSLEDLRRADQQNTEAYKLQKSNRLPNRLEKEIADKIVNEFAKVLIRRNQENADRLLTEQLTFTDQEPTTIIKPRDNNSRKPDLVNEQEAWMRDPSQKHTDITAYVHHGQCAMDQTRQQKIQAWDLWLANGKTQGTWAQCVWTRVKQWEKTKGMTHSEALEATYEETFNSGRFDECEQERHQYQEQLRQQAARQEQPQQAYQQPYYQTPAEASTSLQPPYYQAEASTSFQPQTGRFAQHPDIPLEAGRTNRIYQLVDTLAAIEGKAMRLNTHYKELYEEFSKRNGTNTLRREERKIAYEYINTLNVTSESKELLKAKIRANYSI